ncbi:uncharacterized protein BXZ73DRAFT_76654 [Epithele typhae]|uniref:uncharacterized protein n=1 Tax=Epithele typhae TaxID=378194 RepID=UPI002008BF91|nr:uncharacterized protein BXZ73DRAFT_76654 [Epithele typhae]KAH9936854.1 hypothetical protein BXZ73DRAFT_76654 [Epithele typhae]
MHQPHIRRTNADCEIHQYLEDRVWDPAYGGHEAPGRAQRSSFISSVFKSTSPLDYKGAAEQICNILDNVSTSKWDETSVQIIDVLAAQSDLCFPQPFSVEETLVCGEKYTTDRIYMDEKTFLVNVLLPGEDQFDTLEIGYDTVVTIDIGKVASDATRVSVVLNAPPRLGKDHLKMTPATEHKVLFTFPAQEESRFRQTIRCRTLESLVHIRSPRPQKQSLATHAAYLEVNGEGKLVQRLSQTERIEDVQKFYATDVLSDDIQSANGFEHTTEIPKPFDQSSSPIEDFGDDEVSRSMVQDPHDKDDIDIDEPQRNNTMDSDLTDLSELSSSPSARPRPSQHRTASLVRIRGRLPMVPSFTTNASARLARGGLGAVILDSDDDSPPKRTGRTAKIALSTRSTFDEPEPEGPERNPPSIVPVSLVLQPFLNELVTASPPNRQKPTIKNAPLPSSRREIPAPDFNAAVSSPPAAPNSTLKRSLSTRSALPDIECHAISDPLYNPSAPIALVRPSISIAALRANQVFDDLAPPSSSPSPAVRRPVKQGLRKTGEALTVIPKPLKRARSSETQVPDDMMPPPQRTKRARSSSINDLQAPAVLDDDNTILLLAASDADKLLKPTVRAGKRYRAKGKTSSPHPDGSELGPKSDLWIDYDELPVASVAAPTKAPTQGSPTALTKKYTTRAGAKKTVKKEGQMTKAMKETKTTDEHKDATRDDDPQGTKPAITDATQKSRSKVEAEADKCGIVDAPVDTNAAPKAPKKRPPVPARGFRVPPRPRKTHKGPPDEPAADPDPKKSDKETNSPPDADTKKPAGSTAKPSEVDVSGPTLWESDDREHGHFRLELSSDLLAENTDITFVNEDSAQADPDEFNEPQPSIEEVGDSSDAPPVAKNDACLPPPSKSGSKTPWDAAADLGLSSLSDQHGGEPPTLTQLETVPNVKVPRTSPPAGDTALFSEQLDRSNDPHTTSDFRILTPPTRQAPPPLPKPKKAIIIDLTLDPSSPESMNHKYTIPSKERLSPLPPPPPPKASQSPVEPTVNEVRAADGNLQVNVAIPHKERPPPRDTRGPQRLVRFASKVDERRPASPLRIEPMPGKRISHASSSSTPSKIPTSIRRKATGFTRTDDEDFEEPVAAETRRKDPMEEIIAVLKKINEAVIETLGGKFESVRDDAQAGRMELLQDAAADLDELREESIEHFNRLVDLEVEYATYGRSIIHGTEDLAHLSHGICGELQAAIEKHDRGMLSGKMPPTLVDLDL